MKLKPHQRVSYKEAKIRALSVLDKQLPVNAATIGMTIWPDNNMKAQGLGAAASRILKRMEREEQLALWVCRTISGVQRWGWVKDSCPDCNEVKRHAYSDATTPGFFYDKCSRHRGSLNAT